MILLIDNYDSFTYNLVQRIGEIDSSIPLKVVRNDKISAEEALTLAPEKIIISPGPCTPNEGGVSNDIIKAFIGKVPILGVCLGHQCIGFTHDMTVERNFRLMHGKTSPIYHNNEGVFEGLSNPFIATRYHSLTIRRETIPKDWTVSAWTEENEVMGIRKLFNGVPVEGVQFHPESFLTHEGPWLLANFLDVDKPALEQFA